MGCNLDMDEAAILLLVHPDAFITEPIGSLRQVLDQAGDLLRGPDLHDAHAHEFLG